MVVQQQLPPIRFDQFRDHDRNDTSGVLSLEVNDKFHKGLNQTPKRGRDHCQRGRFEPGISRGLRDLTLPKRLDFHSVRLIMNNLGLVPFALRHVEWNANMNPYHIR